MRTESVNFYSEGYKLGALLRLPDEPVTDRRPVILQGPGWLGLKDAKLYSLYHQVLTDAGYLVLSFDYRGFGDSEGRSDLILPLQQAEDWRNAITYLQTRPDVDPNRIGLFGTGGTGGGCAVYVAAVDKRAKCVVCQTGVADGEDWLHRMRREYEWVDYLARLEQDRRRRVLEGTGEIVDPKEEIMVATPERKSTNVKADVNPRVPTQVQLRSADAIMEFKPIEFVDRISPRGLMIIGVEPDAVTPYDHAVKLFERARAPKRLVVQRETTHYASYQQYFSVVSPMIIEWYNKYLAYGPVEVTENQSTVNDVVYLSKPQQG